MNQAARPNKTKMIQMMDVLDEADRIEQVASVPEENPSSLLQSVKALGTTHLAETLQKAVDIHLRKKSSLPETSSATARRQRAPSVWAMKWWRPHRLRAVKLKETLNSHAPMLGIILGGFLLAVPAFFLTLSYIPRNYSLPHPLWTASMFALLPAFVGYLLGMVFGIALGEGLKTWLNDRRPAIVSAHQLNRFMSVPASRRYLNHILRSPLPNFLQGDVRRMKRMCARHKQQEEERWERIAEENNRRKEKERKRRQRLGQLEAWERQGRGLPELLETQVSDL